MIMVLILALLPSILLMRYIYRLDRVEQEPMWLIRKMFVAGMFSTIGAMLLETAGTFLLRFVPFEPEGIPYNFLFYFIVVAVSEELVKYLPLRRNIWYSPEFNCRFDAVVYAVAVTLGFAAAENIMYAVGFGAGVIPIRGLTAVPMHCICGIFMGHYFGEAKAMEAERRWGAMQLNQVLTMLVPVVLHGYYDFCQSVDNAMLSGSFVFFVIIVDVFAFLSLKRYAREDSFI